MINPLNPLAFLTIHGAAENDCDTLREPYCCGCFDYVLAEGA